MKRLFPFILLALLVGCSSLPLTVTLTYDYLSTNRYGTAILTIHGLHNPSQSTFDNLKLTGGCSQGNLNTFLSGAVSLAPGETKDVTLIYRDGYSYFIDGPEIDCDVWGETDTLQSVDIVEK